MHQNSFEMETKDQKQKQQVTLYLESNPNPNSLKFVASNLLIPEGISFDFADKQSAANSKLATILFDFNFVQRVFIMSNFVTVTKSDGIDWFEIQDEVKNKIIDFIESGKPLVDQEAVASNKVVEEDPEDVKKIKVILDEYIKPAVEQDGGAIIFDSFENGVVKLQLQGSCSGCPSSTITLKAGIENLLKSMMPEVQSVEAESI